MTVPVKNIFSKCQSSPDSDITIVTREYIVDLVKSLATTDCPVVFIEGDDFIGKTVFLMQYAMHECECSISTFINPASKWAYNPDFIRSDLHEQIKYALGVHDTTGCVDNTMFENAIYDLRRKAVRESIVYYFIIDGLDSIPDEDVQIRSIILSMLPIGLKNFRFLISGYKPQMIDDVVSKKVRYTKYPLPGFSLDETRRYFKDINCKQETIEDIYKITKKPGMLSAIKRLLTTGQIKEDSIDELPDKLPQLLDIEWRQVNDKNETELMILAVIVYDKKVNTLDDLGRILNIDVNDIAKRLSTLTFISIDKNSNLVKYVSEPFRKFVATKLKDYRNEATGKIITELYTNPYSDNSMNLLPAFLSETGNYGQLLNYMTPDYFSEMVKCCQSLAPLIKTAEIGVNAANTLHNNGELFRFGLQKSIISQLDGAAIWRSEIEANMAMGDYSSALMLAQSTATKEDKLHALAIIAKFKREQGFTEDEEIGGIIRQLCKEIDMVTLGKRGFEIAEDLIVSYPDLAIELAEKVCNPVENEKSLDLALTKMSISALGEIKEDNNTSNFDAINSRIRNRTLKDFLSITSYVFGNYSVKILLSKIEELESKTDALMLLRQWLKVNRNTPDAHVVMDYAINLTISTTNYSPNATDFKDIAAPLPFITDKDIAKALLSKLDSQKGIIERLGPTEDFVRFEIMLASSALNIELENARDRFIEIYFYISTIDDLVIRGGCYAYMLTMLSIVDKDKVLDEQDSWNVVLKEELDKDIKLIIDGTAHQFDAMKKIIYSLAKYDISYAVKIVESLNTQDVRNKGNCEIIRSAITGPYTNVNLTEIEQLIEKITDISIKDETYLRIINYINSMHEKAPHILQSLMPIFYELLKISDLETRCRALCVSYSILYGTNHDSVKSMLLDQLKTSWTLIDDEWIKINVGYKIVQQISKVSTEEARKYMEYVSEIKKHVFIESDTIAINYISCVYLAMRAFAGLIPKAIYSDEDIDNIYELINEISSEGEKAKLLSVLAMYFYKHNKQEIGEKIVLERIRPILDNIKDTEQSNRIVALISIALYSANQPIADTIIARLPEEYRDDAYYNICRYYLTKIYYIDPFEDHHGFTFKCNYVDVLHICNIISKINSDTYIYVLIDDVTATIKKRRDEFTRQQKEEIARKLNEIVSQKLPNPKYIKHNGYKLACEASIARISTININWESLIAQSKLVPNIADKALVLAVVFTCMPSKQRSKFEQIPAEIIETIKQIPSAYDQMNRYESIASTFKEIDNNLSVQCLKLAMEATSNTDDPEIINRQKRIVDLAARIDSTLASSLTKIYDDDPARLKSGFELKEHLKVLELKKTLVNEMLKPDDLKEENIDKLPAASWKALASLNANMVDTIKIEKVRELVKTASLLSMDRAYPIMCLSIQNIVNRYSKTDEATSIIRPTYEAVLMSCKMSKRMANRSTEINLNAYSKTDRTAEKSIYIKSGQREKAMAFLKTWLENNMDGYLKICDPYFGTTDLEILRMVRGINSSVNVYIVTSKEHQDSQLGACDIADAYSNYWKFNISELAPPETEIIVAGLSSNGKLPIHDRWIVTNNAGLRMGTSINSIGKGRDSEISILTNDEAIERESQINTYIRREKKEHDSTKLRYLTFTL